MEEINLLQTRSKILSTTHAWERQSSLVISILSVILVLLLLAGGGLMFMKSNVTSQIDVINQSNTNLQTQITSTQASLEEAKIFQAQMENVEALLERHISIGSLMSEIERMTYRQAKYLTLAAGNDGLVHVEGQAASYADLGRLLLGLSTSSNFSDVKLLSTVPANDGTRVYGFVIELRVAPTVFTNK